MKRRFAALLLVFTLTALFSGCGYYEDYREIMDLKKKYEQAASELRTARVEAAKLRAEVDRLSKENSDLKEQLKRYMGGVKKMYE